MGAFNKVPEAMRSSMASFTDGKTRLVGGSADTVYIPGRHRDNFMDILALFLETDCFLEIAVPTTIHLVVPPNEDILYLDHVSVAFYSFHDSSLVDEIVLSEVVDMGASIQRHLRPTTMGRRI